MALFTTIMLPLINYFLFVIFGRFVNRSLLGHYVVFSMFCALSYLFFMFPQIVAGNVYVASLGN